MKTAIKLILIYLGIQLVCGGLIGIPFTAVARMNGGNMDATRISELTLAPSMLLSMAVMFFYLWKARYIPKDKMSWSFVSLPFLTVTFLIGLSMTVLMDLLTAVLSWVPDVLEQQFNALQSGWLGIVAITLLGPVLEELLFRGGVTKALLERYSPRKAIFLSALLFGIFHLNPAQVVAAFFGGLLLAWVYYRTRSLIPCILIHIVNNSLSVILSLTYPDADTISDVTDTTSYYILIAVAAMLFVGCFLRIKQVTIPGVWRKSE